MKRRLIWLLLFVAAIVSIIVGWNWQQIRSQTRAAEVGYQPPLKQVTIAPPTVDSQRLLADVEALAFTRYDEDDRRHTRDYITQGLEEAGWTPQTQKFDGGINIVAERSGTDSEAGTILLGAHYDTVEQSPGVDDNATSVAVVLEVARLLGQQPTPRTLQLVFFDLEEVGLVGSEAFVKQVDSETLQGAIVLDMVGYACYTDGCQSYPPVLPITPSTNRGDFLAVIGDQGHSHLVDSFTQTSSAELPPVLTLTLPTMGRFTPDLVRSDHAPFWRNGMGAVLVTDTANFRNPNYHQPSDTVETIDPEFFRGAAQIVVNAVAILLH
ncbi:MAG: M28 family peptidase [Cyanobacteria bacterium CRU_2_1]|nr:M28 family peptidase [Cyanobacteria bacterium RU_5_0]NJR60216.1 M28 family peptidase [Cyanobacteria bacterium CRU_2_1]